MAAGGESAAAVYIDNPDGTSTINNAGYVVGWNAIEGTQARIENQFYLLGDILATSGAHVINNHAGASLIPASRIEASAVNNMAGGTLAIGYCVTLVGDPDRQPQQ